MFSGARANKMWSNSCSTHISSARALYIILVMKWMSLVAMVSAGIPNSCCILRIAATLVPLPINSEFNSSGTHIWEGDFVTSPFLHQQPILIIE